MQKGTKIDRQQDQGKDPFAWLCRELPEPVCSGAVEELRIAGLPIREFHPREAAGYQSP